MATLVSPGVNVTVIDESFFGSAGPGTVPLVIIATEENKTIPDGTATAEWTTPDKAGELFLATSQRELLQAFGDPIFRTIGGTAQHGDPTNEYGLLAAHSYLGLANRAYVLRADIDLSELQPLDSAPTADPAGGTYWLDLSSTTIGLFQWDLATQQFELLPVSFITDASLIDSNGVPLPSAPGAIGSYAMVAGVVSGTPSGREENQIFRRDASVWVLLDNPAISENVIYRSHTQVPQEGELLTLTITAGGTGYAVSDTIDLVDTGSGTGAQIRVDAVSTGAVTEFTILSRGTSYDGTALSQSATSGGGTGFTASAEVLSDNDYWIKTTTPDNGTDFDIKLYDSAASQFVDDSAPLARTRDLALLLYSNNPQAGDLFTHFDHNNENPNGGNEDVDARGEFSIMRHNGAGTTRAVGIEYDKAGTPVDDGDDIIINGVTVNFVNTLNGGQPLELVDTATDTGIVGLINSAAIPNITATDEDGALVLTHSGGLDIEIIDGTGLPLAPLFGATPSEISVTGGYVFSNWSYLVYEPNLTQPVGTLADGRLWFSNTFLVDILVNDGLGHWDEFTGTLFIQSAEPTTGVTTNDLWVDTDNTADYPVLSRYNGTSWIQVDNTDQTSQSGIVFGDARPSPTFGTDAGVNNGGTSGFPDLDPDRPDPLLYPQGMLLWNARYSSMNVKRWTVDYTFEGTLVGDRWVTESGNREDGSPFMGNDAVREVIVEAMQAAVAGNDTIRAESIFYNLICAPGYPEMIDEMVTLNTDRKLTAFIIGDTPMNLPADSTSIQNWATNANAAASNGEDGLITADTYLGLYYPSAFTTNVDGEEVVTAASHIALRTMGFNDQVAYQWFAPAGYRRGVVTNAVNVGYISTEDEFVPVELNQGQRDVLYLNNINPIAFRPNQGLVVFGQKSRHPLTSALDRINVVRLINFIRERAPQLSEPFLFEPNDDITRRQVVTVFERFLEELVTLRGLNDFAVVCDDQNNTPARIDRNELWIDLIIQPLKAIEFIFIPVRVRNTGSDLTLAS